MKIQEQYIHAVTSVYSTLNFKTNTTSHKFMKQVTERKRQYMKTSTFQN